MDMDMDMDMNVVIQPIELVGSTVKLVPLQREHVPALFEVAQFPEIWSYLPTKAHTLDDMYKFADTALDNQEKGLDLPFVVTDADSGKVLGSTRYLNISVPNRHVEIGWTWYTPSVWRSRVNTECKYLLLKHAFEHLGAVRVQFCTDGRNQRSQQAILRLGAKHEGVLRKHRILSDGYIRDTYVFSILQEEWTSVKQRLEHFLGGKY